MEEIKGTNAVEFLESGLNALRFAQKQEGAARETSIAITKVEEALLWLNKYKSRK